MTTNAAIAAPMPSFLSRLPKLDMLMALANQVLVSGMTFLIGIAVARTLGVGEFGRLAMVLILQLFAQYLQGCFVVAPMMSLAGTKPQRKRAYFAGVLAWSAGLSLVAGLAVALIIALIYGLRDGAVPVALAVAAGGYTASQNLLYTVRRVLFAQRTGWQAVVLDAARYAAFLFMLIAAWGAGTRINVAAILWTLAASGLVALVPAWQRVRDAKISRRLLAAIWQRHWPFSQWLALMLLLTFGQEQAIALGLGATLSDEAIGGLRAGQYLIGTTHFVWVALENFVPGRASRAYATGGVTGLRDYLWQTTLMLGLLVWGVILAVSVPAEWSLRLTFGTGYEQYAPILRIFGAAYAIAFWREVWVYYFYPIERTKVIFQAHAAGFAVAMLAFYPAIKMWGVTGAAVTTLLAATTSTVWVMLFAWRHIKRAAQPPR